MPLTARPYQLLCAICRLDEGQRTAVAEAVREAPDRPLRIVCNAGDVYAYQDPGVGADTPEGADYNRKRDLDILQRMGWPPGTWLLLGTLTLPEGKGPQDVKIDLLSVTQQDGQTRTKVMQPQVQLYEKGQFGVFVPPKEGLQLRVTLIDPQDSLIVPLSKDMMEQEIVCDFTK